MILPDQINLAEIAYLQHQEEAELERQSRLVKARELDAGQFDDELAKKLIDSMVGGNADDLEGINLVNIAINTVKRRMSFKSVTAVGDELQTVWLQNLIKYGRLLKVQRDIHRWLIRDGISFLIVDYDEAKKRRWAEGEIGMPTFSPHEAFTSVEAAWNGFIGSGEGCKAHWRNNDANQPLDMVSKRWNETIFEEGEAVTTQRMTLYIAKQNLTAARIEKYKMGDDGWEQHQDTYIDEAGTEQTETFPVWWTIDGTETGESLPIPVVVFRNESLEPSFKKSWGIQFGMDQIWGSFLSSINKSGYQALIALGFVPTTDGKDPEEDGSNLMKIGPRSWVGTSVSKDKADIKTIPAGSVDAIAEGLDKTAMLFGLTADLPLKNFAFTRQVSSAEALQHGEVALIAQVTELIDLNEPNWEEAFELCPMLENIYGGGSWQPVQTMINWQPIEVASHAVKHAEVDAKQKVGIPNKQIAQDTLNYSAEQIESFEGEAGNGEETQTETA